MKSRLKRTNCFSLIWINSGEVAYAGLPIHLTKAPPLWPRQSELQQVHEKKQTAINAARRQEDANPVKGTSSWPTEKPTKSDHH